MRIAIISIKPGTLNSGAEVRNYYLYQSLKQEFNATYYTPQLPKALPTHNILKRVKSLIMGKVPYIEYLRKAKFENKTLEEIKNADIIQFEELESFFAFEKYLSNFKGIVVLDAHNVEYRKFLSDIESQNIVTKLIGKYVAPKIKKLEIFALQKIHYLIVCSQIDKDYFSQYFSKKHIVYIPNGVDTDSITQTQDANNTNILFMGLLSYGSNEDGIRYYLKEIHPIIKDKVVNATLTIVGKNPPLWLQEMADKDTSINVTGFVKDVRMYLYNTSVCICPIRTGSGTRLKILEYMAAGKAVVSTTKGAEGIKPLHSKEIIIADNPKEFAQNIVDLLKNKNKAKTIGINARNYVQKNYSWTSITDKLIQFYKEIKKK